MQKALLISDFNVDVLKGYLDNDPGHPVVESVVASYAPVVPTLLDKRLDIWRETYDFAMVWTRPQAVIDGFAHLLNYEQVDTDAILEQVDRYAQALIGCLDQAKILFVPAWTMPLHFRGYGMLDMQHNLGVSNILMKMNLRLAEACADEKNIFVLDTQKWLLHTGKNATDPKLWYLGKIPFANQVFVQAVKDIKAALRGLRGEAKKLIVLDLDDTLWGGIVGDVGWQNLRLGGHDAVGEAYVDFQRALKAYRNRGIILAIASKNEEDVALEAIRQHPEMVLQVEDFSAWRINWQDKARNIADLAAELNLGLQSVVFIDDNPVERARVQEMLPEVEVPEWPKDVMSYTRTLQELTCFDAPMLSAEDKQRAQYYLDEKKRQALQKDFLSVDDWLESLDITIRVEGLNETNLPRTAQLFNKTNQMNLSTRRLSEAELRQWAEKKNHRLWVFHVSDKFGDSGLTGILSVTINGDQAQIVDFILSCRVMGRKVEETMVYTAYQYARTLGLKTLQAQYLPTPKNKPCLKFWQSTPFEGRGNVFSFDLKNDYQLPGCVHVE